MKYQEKYMMTAFVIHAKKNVLTSKLKKMGNWGVREHLRALPNYTFHTRLNCNLTTAFKGKPFYTEEDLIGTEDCIIPTVSLNSIVMRTVLDRTSIFHFKLRNNKELVDYMTKISRSELRHDLVEYIAQLRTLTKGILQICIRIESITDYMRDMFKESITHHIEMPAICNKRFPLQEALTIALSRNLDALPEKYQPYLEGYKDLGFVNYNEILGGIFDQQLAILAEDDCLPNFILTLGELAYLKKLFVEDVEEALLYCKRENNILPDVKDFELKPLAEYFVNICYEGLEVKED